MFALDKMIDQIRGCDVLNLFIVRCTMMNATRKTMGQLCYAKLTLKLTTRSEVHVSILNVKED